MTDKVFCNHVYVAGPKKGQQCGRFCRKGGPKCGDHQIRVKPKCIHGKVKYRCLPCGGSEYCIHKRRRETCRNCVGSAICDHQKLRAQCKDCHGTAFCIHSIRKQYCIECNGKQICDHGCRRDRCITCKGSGICEHDKLRYLCAECGGNGICKHQINKRLCKECDPGSYLRSIVSRRINQSLKESKSMNTIEYLGCDIEDFRMHLESQFQPGMSWENYGSEWHIDHIVPIKYPVIENGISQPPTLEEVIERLDFENCQPMWANENMSKGNRYIG